MGPNSVAFGPYGEWARYFAGSAPGARASRASVSLRQYFCIFAPAWNALSPFTTCEAEVCGLPIVSGPKRRHPGNGESTGEAGLLAERSDPQALADTATLSKVNVSRVVASQQIATL
jgi:hypothetical protein